MTGKVEPRIPVPRTMMAAVIERFGGPEVLRAASVPVPQVDEDDVLIRVETAGVGVWDPWLREGGGGGKLPLVLGSDGAGIVATVGENVEEFKVGDRAYGYAYNNPKGGFYAEYTAVPEASAALTPSNLKNMEAGALAVSGLTALMGSRGSSSSAATP